jgi:hypothetical protein
MIRFLAIFGAVKIRAESGMVGLILPGLTKNRGMRLENWSDGCRVIDQFKLDGKETFDNLKCGRPLLTHTGTGIQIPCRARAPR